MNQNLKVQRHEVKFYISRSDFEYARYILGQLMERDEYQHSERGYFIRSLYFDDLYDSSVEEKLEGIERREKYRLRIYDTAQNWVKLERKSKDGHYIEKSSVTITREEAEMMCNGDYEFLLAQKGAAAKSIYFNLKRKYYRPIVIIDYIRDAYRLDYNDIRITFDLQIRAATTNLDLFDPDLETSPLLRADTIIMEIKFNNCLPAWFARFLKFDSAVNQAISKYCHGRIGTRPFYFADAFNINQ